MTAQQLKNSILQMAVQGKLVPQDPNDEPASVLLERIRAEKEQLIKEKKIKKEKNPSVIFRGADNLPYEKVGKNEPVCIVDEVPFEIPDSWEWVRLGTILHKLTDGTHSRPQYVDSGIPFVSVKDISSGKLDFSNCKYITEQEHRELYNRCNPEYGDILLSKVGTTGIPVIVDCNDQFSLFVSVALLKFNQNLLDKEYLKYLICSPLVQKQATENTRGVGNKNWVMRDIANTLIVIPPLSEQKRIVEKIHTMQPFINRYDIVYKKIDYLNTSFPDNLKKSILQWAVQGKLVPQDPSDEPAEVLLERIRDEKQQLIKEGKIKKDKHESVIFRRDNSHYEKLDGTERCIDDELPFEIPETWKWIRLGTLFQHNTGKALNASNRAGQKLTYITTSNLYWDRFVLDSLKEMFFTDSEIEKCTVQQGDLLVCEGGDIGRAAIWNYNMSMRIQNHIHRLRAYVPICTRFFYYLFYLYKGAGWIGGKGIAIQGLSSNAIHNLLFPLPPLKEQFRIVEKLDNALQKVNTL